MLKVKLLYDYTKYNDKLEKGIEGFAFETPEEQIARSSSDKFVKVKFEGITDVDVPWRGLEILDEDYLKFAEAINKLAENEELRTLLGNNARERARSLFCKKQFCRSISKIYNEIMEKENDN